MGILMQHPVRSVIAADDVPDANLREGSTDNDLDGSVMLHDGFEWMAGLIVQWKQVRATLKLACCIASLQHADKLNPSFPVFDEKIVVFECSV